MTYNPGVDENDLQNLCDVGQRQLMRMEYLACERTLVRAETIALERADFDTLARLYMPLQECRRQRRQLCGEGVVKLDLLAAGQDDTLKPEQIIADYPHGQLLVAGWGSIEPALRLRQLQSERALYVETFLAAVYPVGDALAVAIVPTADVALPAADDQSIDQLASRLPAHSIVMHANALPRGEPRGDGATYANTMSMWERLHLPFLSIADTQADPVRKIQGYRRSIEVDYACELAHQKLADVAKTLAKRRLAP